MVRNIHDTAWFGVDADGHLALFDTGEDGILPLSPIEQGPEALPVSEEGAYWEQLAAIAEALGHDADDDDLTEPAFLAALGLFSYETDYGLVPYERSAVPERPLRADDLPASVKRQLAWMPLPKVHFASDAVVQPAEFAEEVATWSSPDLGYLTADGAFRHALPGHEEGFRTVYATEFLVLPAAEATAREKAYYQRVAEESRAAARWGYALAAALSVGAVAAWALLAP